jgi:hypothetical protein
LDPQPLYDGVSSLPNASVSGAPIALWFREAIKFYRNQCRGSPHAGSHSGREVLTEIQHVLGFHRHNDDVIRQPRPEPPSQFQHGDQ